MLGGVALLAWAKGLPAEQRLADAQQATVDADTARLAMQFASEMGADGAGMNTIVIDDGEIDFAAD